jgi:glyoxylase-like metal-dependent hydrolase (beta-lactamase superfamily II)
MMKIRRNGRPLDISLILVAAGFLGTLALTQLLRAQVNSSAQQTQRSPTQAPAQPNAANAEVHILHVQGNVYMLVGAGGNITAQAGNEGVLLVDTGLAASSDKVAAAVRQISDKPIRYIINTHVHADHTGGNAAIAKLGSTIAGGNVVGTIGESATQGAAVIAFQNILDRMSAANTPDTAPEGAWPTDTYTGFEKKMFFNDEGIEIIHAPSAHTDGDSIVFFHRSDVISTGDIFVTETYPVIDLKRGGSIQGILDTLNRLIAMSIPAEKQEGGTMFIPGHGRLCDQADLVFYQEMVTIVRDRIQDMVDKHMTLEQVKAAKPTRDYDPRYGRTTGFWTTDMFVEAVYKNLSGKPADKRVSEQR